MITTQKITYYLLVKKWKKYCLKIKTPYITLISSSNCEMTLKRNSEAKSSKDHNKPNKPMFSISVSKLVKVMVIYRVNEMVFYLQVQELIIKIGSIN
jgi:hypothetical protein